MSVTRFDAGFSLIGKAGLGLIFGIAIVAGCLMRQTGFNLIEEAKLVSEEPAVLSADELIEHGSPNNHHIRLPNCGVNRNWAYEIHDSGRIDYATIWAPVIPKTEPDARHPDAAATTSADPSGNAVSNGDEPSADGSNDQTAQEEPEPPCFNIIARFRLYDSNMEEEGLRRLAQTSLTGIVAPDARLPWSAVDQLREGNPDLDVDSAWIIDLDKDLPTVESGERYLALGTTFIILGGLFLAGMIWHFVSTLMMPSVRKGPVSAEKLHRHRAQTDGLAALGFYGGFNVLIIGIGFYNGAQIDLTSIQSAALWIVIGGCVSVFAGILLAPWEG